MVDTELLAHFRLKGNIKMIAFEVFVNDEEVGVIGIEGGIFSVMLSRVDDGSGEAVLNATGTQELVPGSEQYFRWPIPSRLRVGDALSIRVIETDQLTLPDKIETAAEQR